MLADYDLNKSGQGRLSVFLPVHSGTKELRSELNRMVGRPSVTYMGNTRAEEWFINNGRTVYQTLREKAAWKEVFRGNGEIQL